MIELKEMSIQKIKDQTDHLYQAISNEQIKNQDYRDFLDLLSGLEADSRKGVQKLALSYQKHLKDRLSEIHRMEALINFDRDYQAQFLAGVDEVGRGPLAGPVVASCVIMDLNRPVFGVDDSKKLSKEKREELFEQIVEASLFCAIGQADHLYIDQANILNATFAAMNSAIKHVGDDLKKEGHTIDLILVDGNQKIKEQDLRQATVTKGDARSYSIACASILAKVYRDRLMEEMDQKYPAYDFASNVGYGSAKHLEAIKLHGLCEIHRKSFCTRL